MYKNIKYYFLSGLITLAPIIVTIWMLKLIISTLSLSVNLLPDYLRPEALTGYSIPGFGVILTIAIIVLSGMSTANLVGKKLMTLSTEIIKRIPIVNTIYISTKKISDALLAKNTHAFRQAVLVQFPCPGSWSIGFITESSDKIRPTDGLEYLSVYMPATPNPTSGFFLIVEKRNIIYLDIDVRVALKYLLSLGVVLPE